jgi:hypothetical protein
VLSDRLNCLGLDAIFWPSTKISYCRLPKSEQRGAIICLFALILLSSSFSE